MTLSSDWQIGKCLEWYTELPFQDRPRESPVFMIQNTECYFEFCKTGTYYLYLKPKKTSIQLKSFPIIIYSDHTGTTSAGIFSRSCETFVNPNSYILYCSEFSFTKRQQNLHTGHFIRFCFIFQSGDGLSLSLGNKSEDKSVQTGSYLNAEVSVESSYDDFSKLLDAGSDHDAEIKCGKHSIKVHRNILCARSEVFSKMLQSDMLEGTSRIIEIQDMDISYVQDFVRYLYTGAMPELNFEKVKMLYEAGDKYAVRSLMIRCSEYLQDNLSPENAVQCFALADAHSDQNLKDRVKTYMLEEKIYLQDELWLPFCESFPREAIAIYRLSHKRKANEMDDP